jgi:hypothetical protein
MLPHLKELLAGCLFMAFMCALVTHEQCCWTWQQSSGWACAVGRARDIVMSKLPKNLSKDMDKLYKSVRSSVGSAASATGRTARQVREAAFRHANTATSVARERVVPAVKPYTDAAAKHLEPHVRPINRAVNKHVQPRWVALERDFERATHGTPKLQVALTVALVFLLAVWIVRALVRWLTTMSKQTYAQRSSRALKALPFVKGQVAKAQDAAAAKIRAQIAASNPKVEPLLELPPGGLDVDSVMNELEERAANDFRYADGESKATGTIYMVGEGHRDLLNDAYCMFSQANPLHADLFPSVRRMEAEVLAMTAALLGGGRDGVTTVRSPAAFCALLAGHCLPDSCQASARPHAVCAHNSCP